MPFEKIKRLAMMEDDDLGCTPEHIQSVELKLGFDLPDGLRHYYRVFGNHKGKMPFYDGMIGLEELEISKEGFLTFYRGHQDNVCWGIPKRAMESGFVYHKLGEWIKDNNQLENTIAGIGFRNALTSLPFFAFKWNIEASEERKVYSSFKKMEADFNLWNSRFFQNQVHEIVSLTQSEGRINLYIAANNGIDFNRIKSIFKLDWDGIQVPYKKSVNK